MGIEQLGIAEPGNGGSAARAGVLVAGVFAGTLSWMLLLAGISEIVRSRARDRFLAWANRAGGAILLAFSGWLLWQFVGAFRPSL